MGKVTLLSKAAGFLLLSACIVGTSQSAAAPSSKEVKDASKDSPSAKPQNLWGQAPASKSPLKRETPNKSISGGKSGENLRTAAQSLFGYNNGANGFGGNGGGFNNGFGNGFNGQQFAFSPNYAGGGRNFGTNGFGQYNQLGQLGAYNVMDQTQGNIFGTQGQNPYYLNNNYFGGGGFGGQYPYASNGNGGFGQFGGGPFGGGFGGFNSGYFPGGAQYQNQLGSRNFGFVNQGFGNPAFRNPQQGGTGSSSNGAIISRVPGSVQVGTGLEVGNRGFNNNNPGGFPSASGQNYIVGNGIGQPAFIEGSTGGFGFGPFGGLYSGIPGGLYRQPNSIFGLGPYTALSATSGSPSSSRVNSSRPSSSSAATRLQTAAPNRFYQGVRPAGSYAQNSRERLYRYTSNES